MKMFLWILVGLSVTGMALWMVTNPGIPRNPLLIFLYIMVFVAGPIGSFWMLYVAIRHETNPLPMIFLAFMPYAFLWYYFELVRPGKHFGIKR